MRKVGFFGIIILILVLFVWLAANFRSSRTAINKNGKLNIVATIFPLYDFARIVGGDKTNVLLLLPPGVEPHSFEPKPSDITTINDADLFIYAGKIMEPWAEGVIAGAANDKLTTLDVSDGIKMIPAIFHDKDISSTLDPHYWLDFANDKLIIDAIAKQLSIKDPANFAYYAANAENLKNRLDELDNEYKTGLANCASREIIYGGHYAFGYLAKRYDIKYYAAEGISPDAEPTAKDLAGLVNQIKQNKIQYVFFEELTSPKIAETLAAETNAKLLLLNAAHNVSRDQVSSGENFISIMQKNLVNLKTGMQCR